MITIAPNNGVMARGKWKQMMESLFYKQSERRAGGLLSSGGQSTA